MQSQTQPITNLFRDPLQYLIPLFQRGYVWQVEDGGRAQVRHLWEDILDRVEAHEADRLDRRTVGADRLRPVATHFLGAIVLGPKQSSANGSIDGREVIDGQQRLTTLQLLLLALRDTFAAFDNDDLDGDLRVLTANRVRGGSGSDRLKVLPTNVGRRDMQALVDARSPESVVGLWPASAGERPRMVQAYLYFAWMSQAWLAGADHDEVVAVRRGTEVTRADAVAQAAIRADEPPSLDGLPDADRAWLLTETLDKYLEVVELRLDEADDPQVIFESLNALGEPLRPSDLIRNFLFLEASRAGADVEALYTEHWQVFDEERGAKNVPFWQEEQRQGRLTSARLDVLLYHITTLRLARTLKIGHVFESFKSWWRSESERDIGLELARIKRLAGPMRTVFLPERSDAFGSFCWRMRLLDTAVHVPLLLAFVEYYGEKSEAVAQVMSDIESYVVRRFVCGLSTNGYNRLFNDQILKQVNAGAEPEPERLRSMLLGQTKPSAIWPDDAQFAKAWREMRLYQGNNSNRVQAILWGLEDQLGTGHQEYMLTARGVSVEHVLPQNWNETDHPLDEEEGELSSRRDDLIHSIGNLTLVTPGFNSALSNRAFVEKRPALARESMLRLNTGFQDEGESWTEREILVRADRLFVAAVEKWARPEAAP